MLTFPTVCPPKSIVWTPVPYREGAGVNLQPSCVLEIELYFFAFNLLNCFRVDFFFVPVGEKFLFIFSWLGICSSVRVL